MSDERCSECGATGVSLEYGMCPLCANSEWDSEAFKLRPRRAKELYDSLFTQVRTEEDLCRMVADAEAEITALRAALDQERARIRELAESPPMASISLCCGIVRPGHYAPDSMHHGLCRYQHHGELGKTYYLHDVSALLSGRGEGGNDG